MLSGFFTSKFLLLESAAASVRPSVHSSGPSLEVDRDKTLGGKKRQRIYISMLRQLTGQNMGSNIVLFASNGHACIPISTHVQGPIIFGLNDLNFALLLLLLLL